jgi:hypothetical protein
MCTSGAHWAWFGTTLPDISALWLVNSSGNLSVQPPASCPLASTSKANQMAAYQAYFHLLAPLAFPSAYEFTNGGPKHFVAAFRHFGLNDRGTVTL